MKQIALDLRFLSTSTSKRGVGYYNRSLFKTILKNPHKDWQFNIFTFPFSKLQDDFSKGVADKFIPLPSLYWPKKGLRKLDPLFSLFWRSTLTAVKPKLLHIPFLFDTYYLDIPNNIPTVVTLYDIIPLLFPNEYFQNEKAKVWYSQRLKLVRKAVKIITISHSSKKDLVQLVKIPPEKIEVVYGGVDERFKVLDKKKVEEVLKKYQVKNKFILTVSTHSFHKNTEKMFELIKDLNLNLVVVCNLIPSEERDWRNQIKKLKVEDKVILTNFVNDEDLPAFFCGAEIFLFPSIYEGLGLPVLEAFACGCPVITSNTSSLPEVGGEAALYVNPKEKEDIRKAIAKLLNNQNLREDLRGRGFTQVKKFSWNKAARQTLQVYNEVLNDH